jgi:hypothetical protein
MVNGEWWMEYREWIILTIISEIILNKIKSGV